MREEGTTVLHMILSLQAIGGEVPEGLHNERQHITKIKASVLSIEITQTIQTSTFLSRLDFVAALVFVLG